MNRYCRVGPLVSLVLLVSSETVTPGVLESGGGTCGRLNRWFLGMSRMVTTGVDYLEVSLLLSRDRDVGLDGNTGVNDGIG